MNYGIIRSIIGWTLILEAALMAPSAVVAIIYGEAALWSFVATIALCLIIGRLLTWKKPVSQVFFAREGFCQRCFKLDCFKYYGRTSLLLQWLHYQSH